MNYGGKHGTMLARCDRNNAPLCLLYSYLIVFQYCCVVMYQMPRRITDDLIRSNQYNRPTDPYMNLQLLMLGMSQNIKHYTHVWGW